MKEIPLTRGMVAIIDDEDFDDISQFKWYFHHSGYAARKQPRKDGAQKMEFMHRRILGLSEGSELAGDHINRQTLDNRRRNLRSVTQCENNRNRRLGASGFRGVSRIRDKWRAYIVIDGKQKYLGTFCTPEEASREYEITLANQGILDGAMLRAREN